MWHCAGPAEYGHLIRPQPKKPRTEEDEQRAEERRKVIACNRAWKAAVGPRQEFVTRLVRMKPLPEAARSFAQGVLLTLPSFYIRDRRALPGNQGTPERRPDGDGGVTAQGAW